MVFEDFCQPFASSYGTDLTLYSRFRHGLYLTNRQLMCEMRDFLRLDPLDPEIRRWIQLLRKDQQHSPYISINCSPFGLINTVTLSIPIPKRLMIQPWVEAVVACFVLTDPRVSAGSTSPPSFTPSIEYLHHFLFIYQAIALPDSVHAQRNVEFTRDARYLCAVREAYTLYIPHLNVILTGDPNQQDSMLEGFGDLEFMNDDMFIHYIKEGKVNCKTVTFSIETSDKYACELQGEGKDHEKGDERVEGLNKGNDKGKEKKVNGDEPEQDMHKAETSTDRETTFEKEHVGIGGARLVYSLTTTVDKEGRQFRRRYASATRFKA